jgi:adenine-specific DNA-methyltransferase
MDFVIGNPPYVRVHNLADYANVKQYSFAQDGMTDLYIVFYEIGLSMLNDNGILCYINPSSIFNSVAGNFARSHFLRERLLTKVVDLKHYQPFEATTYTAIMVLSKGNNKDMVGFYEYDAQKGKIVFVDNIKYSGIYINGAYYFAENNALSAARGIMARNPSRGIFDVKNGFATLYDDFFIGDLGFDDYTIPIVKASTGRISTCFFPYDENGGVVPYEVLTQIPSIKRHYERHSDRLRSRSLENMDVWHVFGRSQGIQDVPRRKYAINALIRDIGDIKLIACDPGVGVYSGLYILTEVGYEELKNIIFNADFVAYVKMLGKYKSGGYYTYSSKDLLKYLDYKYAERNNFCNEQLGNNIFDFYISEKIFKFGKTIVYNDYEKFAEKITYSILGI